MAGNLGLLIGRASIGLMIAIGHGWDKVYQSADGHFGPPQMMIDELVKRSIPAPTVAAWCSALAEFLGGLFVAVGFLTRPTAAILAFNMAVAAFYFHGADPIFMTGQGAAKEPALLYFFPAVMFMLTGAGHFSADRMFSTLNEPTSAGSKV
jgi:putative oxidoreductase